MEPRKEARTRRDAVARPPGVATAQTPDEEARREGGASLAGPAVDLEADGASADGLWQLPVEPAARRPECGRCR